MGLVVLLNHFLYTASYQKQSIVCHRIWCRSGIVLIGSYKIHSEWTNITWIYTSNQSYLKKKQSMAILFPSNAPYLCLIGTLIIKLSILKKARSCYELQRLLMPLASLQFSLKVMYFVKINEVTLTHWFKHSPAFLLYFIYLNTNIRWCYVF